jgi:hypothetical protein
VIPSMRTIGSKVYVGHLGRSAGLSGAGAGGLPAESAARAARRAALNPTPCRRDVSRAMRSLIYRPAPTNDE